MGSALLTSVGVRPGLSLGVRCSVVEKRAFKGIPWPQGQNRALHLMDKTILVIFALATWKLSSNFGTYFGECTST